MFKLENKARIREKLGLERSPNQRGVRIREMFKLEDKVRIREKFELERFELERCSNKKEVRIREQLKRTVYKFNRI